MPSQAVAAALSGPRAIWRLGVGRTFQINTLFRNMSVLDNVALSVAERHGVAGRMWRPAGFHKSVRDEATAVFAADASAAQGGKPIKLS